MARRNSDLLTGWVIICAIIAYPFIWFYETFGWGGYAVLALVIGLLRWAARPKKPAEHSVSVARAMIKRRDSVQKSDANDLYGLGLGAASNRAPDTRDRALFNESLDIIRKSTNHATVESRYDLMQEICRRQGGWLEWANELEEARQKRHALLNKKIELDEQRHAKKLANHRAGIVKKALVIVAAQPGITQVELLPLVQGYTLGEVRSALSYAAKNGQLHREKYRSTYKLFLIEAVNAAQLNVAANN